MRELLGEMVIMMMGAEIWDDTLLPAQSPQEVLGLTWQEFVSEGQEERYNFWTD